MFYWLPNTEMGTLNYAGNQAWQIASHKGDDIAYVAQSTKISLAKPPYVYRWLPSFLARVIANIIGMALPSSYALLNALWAIGAGLLMVFYLSNLGFSRAMQTLGACLTVTCVGMTRTIAFPMVDPPALFFVVAIFISVLQKNAAAFVIASCLGVCTKEVLVFSGIMWMVENGRKAVSLLGLLPLAVMLFVRAKLGTVSEIDRNIFLFSRLADGVLLWKFAVGAFLSFGFIWFGLAKFKSVDFVKRHFYLVPLLLLMTFCLSSRAARPLSMLVPVVIPAFLKSLNTED